MNSNKPILAIQKMVQADMLEVMKIEKARFKISPWEQDSSFLNGRKGDAFVLRGADGAVLGYVLLKQDGYTINLVKMAVDPAFGGRGLGKLILCWTEVFAKSKGATRLFLHVRRSNTEAHSLYKGYGFKEQKPIEDGYREGETSDEKAKIPMEKAVTNRNKKAE